MQVLSVELFRTTKEGLAKHNETVEYMKLQGYTALYPKTLWGDVVFMKSEYAKGLEK